MLDYPVSMHRHALLLFHSYVYLPFVMMVKAVMACSSATRALDPYFPHSFVLVYTLIGEAGV